MTTGTAYGEESCWSVKNVFVAVSPLLLVVEEEVMQLDKLGIVAYVVDILFGDQCSTNNPFSVCVQEN